MALISKAVIVCTILYPWRSLLYPPWTACHREVGPTYTKFRHLGMPVIAYVILFLSFFIFGMMLLSLFSSCHFRSS